MMVKATVDGCKKIAFVVLNVGAGATLAIQFAKSALKSVHGPPLAQTVLLPVTAADYSSEVAQAANGTDCIAADIAEANFPPFITAFSAAGDHQRLYGPQGNLDALVTKQFPQATEGAVVAGTYSDISLPAWADYRAALAQYHAPTNNVVYNSLGGLGTWAAYQAFRQIADAIKGPITNQTFLAAAQKATVNLGGMAGVGSIDFSQKFTGLGAAFSNLYNRAVTFDVVHNGNVVPFDHGKFFDITNAVSGRPLPASDTPPAGQQG
jgi:hypothetical protein